MAALFADRAAAGRVLADRLRAYAGRADVVVAALARAGVPVACEVAALLSAPLELMPVRRLWVPGQVGVSMGAMVKGAVHVDGKVLLRHGVSALQLDKVISTETVELLRREAMFQGVHDSQLLEGRIVIVVDDGIATGATMSAALKALRQAKPAWVVVAVPVAPARAQDRIDPAADEFVCLESPANFDGIASSYADYRTVTDEQVRRMVELGRRLF